MSDTEPAPAEAQPVLFRPSKKRKIYRQRAPSPTTEPPSHATPASPSAAPAPGVASPASDDEAPDAAGASVSMTSILRMRKLRKHRVGGVEFRVASPTHSPDPASQALASLDAKPDADDDAQEGGLVVAKKFVSQTGTTAEGVDKHMMAYIDSELAKRLQPASAPTNGGPANPSITTIPPRRETSEAPRPAPTPHRQPATLGKLHEIDLGAEAHERNIQRTALALDPSGGASDGQKAKVRLGRDGKPWRGRKRRTSDDLRRDALVEAVLHENRLEHYEAPAPVMASRAGDGGDGEADDELAEKFRREFMDAVAERGRKKTVPVSAAPARGPGGKKEEEVLKGPKLGGSRSTRAAMRDLLLKAQEGKK